MVFAALAPPARLTQHSFVVFAVDSDCNRTTGDAFGFDYVIGTTGQQTATFQTATGRLVDPQKVDGAMTRIGPVLFVKRQDLGAKSCLRVYARPHQGNTFGTDRSNGSTVWTYRLKAGGGVALVTTGVNWGRVLIIGIFLSFVLALIVINVLKGKYDMAAIGLVVHVTWYAGAIRLAKPGSWWDRHLYQGKRESKHVRAVERHMKKTSPVGEPSSPGSPPRLPFPQRPPEPSGDGWLAGTVPKSDEAVPVQRRNPDTGKWVTVYVPADATESK